MMRKLVIVGVGAAVLTAGVLAASGVNLKAPPITLSAAGAATPAVESVVNGKTVPLSKEGPAEEPQDWTFSPSFKVLANGAEGGVPAAEKAVFFTGSNHRASSYKPSFAALLLPNADSGSTTIHLSNSRLGADLTTAVTITPAPKGVAAAGAALYAGNCAACHGSKAQGGLGPDLTYTDQGIGGWAIWQFNRAVRVGVDDEAAAIGRVMPRWQETGFAGQAGKPPTPQQITDIFAFLKTLK